MQLGGDPGSSCLLCILILSSSSLSFRLLMFSVLSSPSSRLHPAGQMVGWSDGQRAEILSFVLVLCSRSGATAGAALHPLNSTNTAIREKRKNKRPAEATDLHSRLFSSRLGVSVKLYSSCFCWVVFGGTSVSFGRIFFGLFTIQFNNL